MIGGGAAIYAEAMPLADRLYISHVALSPEGDAFFPPIDPDEWEDTGGIEIPPNPKDFCGIPRQSCTTPQRPAPLIGLTSPPIGPTYGRFGAISERTYALGQQYGGGGRNNNNGGGPWGQTPGGSGGGGDLAGAARPSLEEILNRGREQFGGNVPGGRWVFLGGLVVVVAFWLLNSIYTIDPQEVGVETTFGRPSEQLSTSGLHFMWWPIQSVERVNILQNKTEIGSSATRSGRSDDGVMLTSDQNIVEVKFAVLWTIQDPKAYLFNVRDPDDMVRAAGERHARGRGPQPRHRNLPLRSCGRADRGVWRSSRPFWTATISAFTSTK